jgi:hypothetical protein
LDFFVQKKQPKVINDLMGGFSDWANFAHSGDCFFGIFLDYRGSPNIWTILFHVKGCELILAKNGLGHISGILVDFFANLSGHPARHSSQWILLACPSFTMQKEFFSFFFFECKRLK